MSILGAIFAVLLGATVGDYWSQRVAGILARRQEKKRRQAQIESERLMKALWPNWKP